ncbi:unnamed protein product [Parajaminaea phylloscopi]
MSRTRHELSMRRQERLCQELQAGFAALQCSLAPILDALKTPAAGQSSATDLMQCDSSQDVSLRQAPSEAPGGKNISRTTHRNRQARKGHPKRTSHISRLPDEVIATVFSWLFHGSATPEPLPPAILLVCRKWRRIALSTKGIWWDTSDFTLTDFAAKSNPEWDLEMPADPDFVHSTPLLHDHQILNFCDERTEQSLQKIVLRLEGSSQVIDALHTAADSWPTLRQLELRISPDRPRTGASPLDKVDTYRAIIYDLIRKSESLTHLKLRMPAPVCAQAMTQMGIASWPQPAGALKSLTLLDAKFHEIEDGSVNEVRSAGARFWGSLSRHLTVCNVATLHDVDIVYAVLTEAAGTLEVLLVNVNVFGTVLRNMSAQKLVFRRLNRLCLLGSWWSFVSDWISLLPCLQEIEGPPNAVQWAAEGNHLTKATIWLEEADFPLDPILIDWKLLTQLRHLTLVGPADEVLTRLRLLGVEYPQAVTNSAAAGLWCPSVEVLTLVLGRDPRLVAKYSWPRLRFRRILEQDWQSQYEVAHAAHRVVRERKRYGQGLRRLAESGQQVTSEVNTIKRLTIRNFWCSQRQLWDLRASYSTKMTQARVPDTIAPEGALPYAGLEDGCVFDIVPEVPQHLKHPAWKATVAEAMEGGLHCPF